MSEMDIVGALDPGRAVSKDAIRSALDAGQQTLIHGETFTGRPATRIYSDERHVLKLRTELHFTAGDARRWIERTIERERNYAIHHPAKTWLLLHDSGREPVIANATPRLTPLHLAISQRTPAEALVLLEALFELYFRIAATHERHLDEGLSNFGCDSDERVFYLDDDIYNWNDFASLSNTLGVWVRQLDHFSAADFSHIGTQIRAAVDRHFRDPHWATVIAEQLRGLFTGNAAQRDRLDALLQALYPPPGRARRDTPHIEAGVLTREKPVESGKKGRLALLADIHANLPALDATLAYLEEKEIEQGIVLGDVVGYGPHPGECIERLVASGLQVIKGNHDHAVAIGEARQGFSAMSRWVIDWTVERIDEAQRRWLNELPVYLREDDWLAVHGAPQDKTFFNGYVYRLTFEDNLDNLENRSIRLCFHGHTHIQGAYYRAHQKDHQSSVSPLSLHEIDYALVCPGAVGQPRSGHPGAEFAVYDMETGSIEFMRVDYDIERTVSDLNRHQFPPQLATRLLAGR